MEEKRNLESLNQLIDDSEKIKSNTHNEMLIKIYDLFSMIDTNKTGLIELKTNKSIY